MVGWWSGSAGGILRRYGRSARRGTWSAVGQHGAGLDEGRSVSQLSDLSASPGMGRINVATLQSTRRAGHPGHTGFGRVGPFCRAPP